MAEYITKFRVGDFVTVWEEGTPQNQGLAKNLGQIQEIIIKEHHQEYKVNYGVGAEVVHEDRVHPAIVVGEFDTHI
jgi:hypothetical protein